MGTALLDDAEITALALDLGKMIEAARQQVVAAANAALTTLYWQIGRRILIEVLDGHRAEYGAKVVAALGRDLEARHGRGFGEKSLRHMIRFAEAFPDPEDFLDLADTYSENDLESAILREIERFLLELANERT